MYPWIVKFNQEASDYEYLFEGDYYYNEGYPICKLHGYFVIDSCVVDRQYHSVSMSGITKWFSTPVEATIYDIFLDVDNDTAVTQSSLSFVNTLNSVSPTVCTIDFDGDIKSSKSVDMEEVLSGCSSYISNKYSGGQFNYPENYSDRYLVSDWMPYVASEDPEDTYHNYEEIPFAAFDVDYGKQVFSIQPTEYNYFYHTDIPVSLSQVCDIDGKLWYPLLPSVYSCEALMIPHLEYYRPNGKDLVLTHSFLPPFTETGTYPYLNSSGEGYVEMIVTNSDQVQLFIYEDGPAEIQIDFEIELGNGLFIVYTDEGGVENYYYLSSSSRVTQTFTVSDPVDNYFALVLMTEELADNNKVTFYSIKINGIKQDLEELTNPYGGTHFYGYEWVRIINDYLPIYYPPDYCEEIELKYSSLDWPENRRVEIIIYPVEGDSIIAISDNPEQLLGNGLVDTSCMAYANFVMRWGYGGETMIDSLPTAFYSGFGIWTFYGARLHSDQLLQAWVSVSSSSLVEISPSSNGKYDVSDLLVDDSVVIVEQAMSPSSHTLKKQYSEIAYYTSVDIYKEEYNPVSEEWEYTLYDTVAFDYSWYDWPNVEAGRFNFPVSTDYFYTKEGTSYRCRFVFNCKSLFNGGTGYPKFLARIASPHEHIFFKSEETLVNSFCGAKRRRATGLVSITNGSAVVTGDGTKFTDEVTPGDYIQISTSQEIHEVAKINSDTELELTLYCDSTLSSKIMSIFPGWFGTNIIPEGGTYTLLDTTVSKSVNYPEFSEFTQFNSVVSGVSSWDFTTSQPATHFGSVLDSGYSIDCITAADFRYRKLYIVASKFSGLNFDIYIDDEYIRTISATLDSPYVNVNAREHTALNGKKWVFFDADDIEILEAQITAPIMKLEKLLLDDQLQARILNPGKTDFRIVIDDGGGTPVT